MTGRAIRIRLRQCQKPAIAATMVNDLCGTLRGRQNAGPSQHACRKRISTSGVPVLPPKCPKVVMWALKCRERRERESEDEPAPKEGENSPLYSLISL